MIDNHEGYLTELLTESSAVVTEGGGGARFFLRREARMGGIGASSNGFVLSTLSLDPVMSLRAMRGVALKIL